MSEWREEREQWVRDRDAVASALAGPLADLIEGYLSRARWDAAALLGGLVTQIEIRTDLELEQRATARGLGE